MVPVKNISKVAIFFHMEFSSLVMCPPGSGNFSAMFMLLRRVFSRCLKNFQLFLIFEISSAMDLLGICWPVMNLVVRISVNIKKIMKIHVQTKKTQRSNINIPEKYPEPGGHVLNTKTSAWKKITTFVILKGHFLLENQWYFDRNYDFHWFSLNFTKFESSQLRAPEDFENVETCF